MGMIGCWLSGLVEGGSPRKSTPPCLHMRPDVASGCVSAVILLKIQ